MFLRLTLRVDELKILDVHRDFALIRVVLDTDGLVSVRANRLQVCQGGTGEDAQTRHIGLDGGKLVKRCLCP